MRLMIKIDYNIMQIYIYTHLVIYMRQREKRQSQAQSIITKKQKEYYDVIQRERQIQEEIQKNNYQQISKQKIDHLEKIKNEKKIIFQQLMKEYDQIIEKYNQEQNFQKAWQYIKKQLNLIEHQKGQGKNSERFLKCKKREIKILPKVKSDKNSEEMLKSLNQLAQIYSSIGQFSESQLVNMKTQIKNQIRSIETGKNLKQCEQRAKYFRDKKDYKNQLKYLIQSQKILQKSSLKQSQPTRYLNLIKRIAMTYTQLKDFQKSNQKWKELLEKVQNKDQFFEEQRQCQEKINQNNEKLKKFNQVIQYFKKQAEKFRQVNNFSIYCQKLLELAIYCQKINKFEQSIDFRMQVIQIQIKLYGNESLEYISSLQNLVRTYQKANMIQQSEKITQKLKLLKNKKSKQGIDAPKNLEKITNNKLKIQEQFISKDNDNTDFYTSIQKKQNLDLLLQQKNQTFQKFLEDQQNLRNMQFLWQVYSKSSQFDNLIRISHCICIKIIQIYSQKSQQFLRRLQILQQTYQEMHKIDKAIQIRNLILNYWNNSINKFQQRQKMQNSNLNLKTQNLWSDIFQSQSSKSIIQQQSQNNHSIVDIFQSQSSKSIIQQQSQNNHSIVTNNDNYKRYISINFEQSTFSYTSHWSILEIQNLTLNISQLSTSVQEQEEWTHIDLYGEDQDSAYSF